MNHEHHHRRRVNDRRYWTATGVIPRWQLVAVYALVIGACIVGFVTIGNAVHRANSATRANRALAQRADAQARATQRQAAAIQRQRRELCKDQNDRHDATIRELDVIVRRLEHTAPPAQRAQLKASRAYNVLLINALAPRRRCAEILTYP